MKASPAFDAFPLINHVDLVLGADDRLYGASPGARHAGLTLFRVDIVRDNFTEQLVYLVFGKKRIILFRV